MNDVVRQAKYVLEGVTDGPWEATAYGVEQPYEFDLHRFDQMPLRIARTDQSDADSRFIAAARTLVPELIAEIERARDSIRARYDRVEDLMLAAETPAETSRHANEMAGLKFALDALDAGR